MMALAGVKLKTLVSEPDALTTRPPLNQRQYRLAKQIVHTFVFELLFIQNVNVQATLYILIEILFTCGT